MSYSQEIYDAVRSRISGGNLSQAVADVAREALDISYLRQLAQQEIAGVGYEWQRPSAVYRPSLAPDGTQWCALYGENLMEGVAGFGDTPAEAMADFDKNWWKQITPKAANMARAIAEEEATEEALANSQFGVGA